MKKLSYILMTLAVLTFTLSSCNPTEFLDRPSKTTMNDSNYWSSEANIRLFVNGGYENYFNGYHNGWSYSYAPGVRGDGAATEWSDDICRSGTQTESIVAATSYSTYYSSESISFSNYTQSCAWNFGWVRKWNLLIERLNTMNENGILTGEAFNHWMGVARFLRGYEYSRLVMSFGDVPYYDHVVASDNFDEQYKDRDNRVTVMNNVMEDFKFAMNNVRANDGANYINKGVVGAYASRFMLFEGTWETYHKTAGGNAKAFLEAARDFAAQVMALGTYKFNCSFYDLFASNAQVGNETIMYRSYDANLSVRHCIATYCMPQYGQGGYANLNHFQSWICQDGKPYTTSTTPGGNSFVVKDMIQSRDSRFEETFYEAPFNVSGGGLFCWKFINRAGPYAYPSEANEYGGARNVNGAPVIRYAEVVLNWVEAKCELADNYGGAAVSQADLDASINAIRNRPLSSYATAAGVKQTAPLTLALAAQNAAADPQYNDAVYKVTLASKNGFTTSPLMWEIRRERRMEFFIEHVRSMDIRRWGELERMNCETNLAITRGVYLVADDCGEKNAKFYNADGSIKPECKEAVGLVGNNRWGSKRAFQYTLAHSNYAGNSFNNPNVKKVQPDMNDFNNLVVYTVTESDANGNVVASNKDQMTGFKVMEGLVFRRAIRECDYLLPVPTSVTNQYSQKGYTITQNPGW